MRIRAVSLYTVDLPLAQSFQHASSGLIERLEEVVLKVETDAGATGWAEVRGNASYVTAETRSRVVAALADLLLPRLMAQPQTSPSEVKRFLDRIVAGNSTAKAAIDIAVHDAAAREMGAPLCTTLGGGRDAIRIHGTLPFCTPEEAARRAASYLDQGLRIIKVRVGLKPFDRDLARLEAVRRCLADRPAGAEARIAIDANQGWSVKEAIRALRRFETFDLAWVEQPTPAHDLAGLKEIRDGTPFEIVADESCGAIEDLLRIVEARAADGVHLKLVKAGGVRPLMAMAAIAEAAGLPYLVGQMDEGMLATAAGLHCAAATAPLSCELWGYQRVGAQPFSGLRMADGAIRLPEEPGLGIAVDESALTLVRRFEAAR
jgi:L-alanine-DL-glutamate epimerase-like enolase superfamily enzyme